MSEHLDHNRLQTDNLPDNRNATARPTALSDRVRSLRLENPPAVGGSRFGWLPWVLCGIFALLAAGFGITAFVPLDKFAPAKKPAADDTAKADSGDVVLEQKGYIIPSRTYQVSPKVGGMVQKLYIQKEGDIFKEGAVLAELEIDDYEADVDHSKATLTNARERLAQLKKDLPEEIKKAEYELEQAKSQLRQYLLDWDRAEDLFRRQSIGKSEYDQARANKEAKESEVSKLMHAHRLVKGTRTRRTCARRSGG
jgi:multidrug efflux pump subunit AcrA (membrane-fusion protein)